MGCDKEYICVACHTTFSEGDDDLYNCHDCRGKICGVCGGEIDTIEEFDRNKRDNYESN